MFRDKNGSKQKVFLPLKIPSGVGRAHSHNRALSKEYPVKIVYGVWTPSTLAFHVCKTYYSLVFYMAKNANGMLMGVKAILVFQGGQCVTEYGSKFR